LQLPEMYEENWRINKQVFFLYLIGLMTLESIFANMYLQLRRIREKFVGAPFILEPKTSNSLI